MWCYRAAAILLPAAETQQEWVVLSGWLMDLNKDCQAMKNKRQQIAFLRLEPDFWMILSYSNETMEGRGSEVEKYECEISNKKPSVPEIPIKIRGRNSVLMLLEPKTAITRETGPHTYSSDVLFPRTMRKQ